MIAYKLEKKVIIGKTKLADIIGFLYAILAFLRLNPFFLWETYCNGRIGRLFGVFQTVNIIAILVIILSVLDLVRKGRVTANNARLVILLLVSGFVIIYISGRHNVMNRIWINYVALSLFLLSDSDIKMKSFRYFKYVFSITLIPAVLWHLLVNIIGISINYTNITPVNETKIAYEYTYRHYWGAIQLFGRWDPSVHLRLNGIYDEPGVVGSIAGLLLTTSFLKKENKSFVNVLLFIEGMLSLSLAFIMFLVIYALGTSIMRHNTKGLFVIIGFVLVYLAFINIDFSNKFIILIQERVRITSTGLSGNDRTSEQFNMMYSQFKNSSDLLLLMFGYGPNLIATTEGKSLSYKNIIYEYGYSVFLLFISFILSYAYSHKKTCKEVGIIIILTLANIYQRAGLFYFPYMLTFIGGISFIENEQREAIGFMGNQS